MTDKIGCIHGRFQPVHREHEEYIFAAYDKCDHLIIGITQYKSSAPVDCAQDPHRSKRFSNPLTYEERVCLIRRLFEDRALPADTYSFSPFPIDEPEIMHKFIGKDVKCFTTLVEDWNTEKITRLKSLGYDVDVLWNRVGLKGISATHIRALAFRKEPLWRTAVSPSIALLLDEYDFENRLIHLHENYGN